MCLCYNLIEHNLVKLSEEKHVNNRKRRTRMKRTDLEALGLEKDNIDAIMKLHGADIESKKAEIEKLAGTIKEKEETIGELNETIKTFDGKDETLKDLQEKVEKYELADKEAKEQAEKDKAENELKTRFSSLVGENKWADEDIENGRYNAFKQAIGNEENKGKGDSEIFELITKDRNCFVNPQQEKVKLPSIGNKQSEDKPKMKNFF